MRCISSCSLALLLFIFLPFCNMDVPTVIVVGGGLAGLSAAIEAASSDPSIRVILIEKESSIGYE